MYTYTGIVFKNLTHSRSLISHVLCTSTHCICMLLFWYFEFVDWLTDLVETGRGRITLGTQVFGGLEQKGIKSLQDCIKV